MQTQNPFDTSLFQIEVGASTNPAAGASAVITQPTGGRSELLALGFTFTTDANAADRYISLVHTSNSVVLTFASSYVAHTASLGILWIFAPGMVNQPPIATGRALVALPPYPAIFPADFLNIYVTGIQAGDAFTLIRHAFKVWPTA